MRFYDREQKIAFLKDTREQARRVAMAKALAEYRKFQVKTLSPVEQDYLESIRMIEKKAKGKKDS